VLYLVLYDSIYCYVLYDMVVYVVLYDSIYCYLLYDKVVYVVLYDSIRVYRIKLHIVYYPRILFYNDSSRKLFNRKAYHPLQKAAQPEQW
jgi:hypothetical protein